MRSLRIDESSLLSSAGRSSLFPPSVDYVEGYYNGFDDGIAVMANAMTMIDDKEAASGFALSKEQYRAVLRAAVGHNSNARSNRKVRQLLEMK